MAALNAAADRAQDVGTNPVLVALICSKFENNEAKYRFKVVSRLWLNCLLDEETLWRAGIIIGLLLPGETPQAAQMRLQDYPADLWTLVHHRFGLMSHFDIDDLNDITREEIQQRFYL